MRNNKTFNLTLIAIFTALIVLQTYVPNLGYIVIIPTLPAISTIVLTVTIGGALLGPKSGAVLGLIWGSLSLLSAYTRATDMVTLLLFRNPVIAIVPRVLVGVFAGLVVLAFKKNQLQAIGLGLSGLIVALTNTLFVIILSSLFYMGNSATLVSQLGNSPLGAVNPENPLIIILFIALGLNGVVEAVVGTIITPIIVTPLQRVLRRLRGS